MWTLLLACTPLTLELEDTVETADSGEGPVWGASVYEPLRLLEVEVELEPEDWEVLRHQQRNILEMLTGEDCLAEPFESPYDWFEGDLTIDGQDFPGARVRKKGLLGSVEPGRPSLKLDLGDEQDFEEVARFTLNNGRQDASRFKTCMGYEILGRAGVAAPRCSLAHVTVNGEDLGLYANVEPIKPPLLAREFGGDGDNGLYEGTLSDFVEGWDSSFQPKNGGEGELLRQITAAVAEPDDDVFLQRIEELVDVDQFMAFWAMEVILGHWDGYAGNTNNFWVYVGDDGRLRFLPWGIDAVLVGEHPFGQGLPTSVVATGALARRFYLTDEGQRLYLDTVDRLLTEVWDEQALQEHFEALVEVGAPYAWPEGKPDAWYDVIDQMEWFIANREAVMRQEIEQGPATWPYPVRGNPCLKDHGTLTVSFSTTWGSYGTLPTWSTGSGSLSASIDGVDYAPEFMTAIVGEYEEGQSVLLVAGTLEDGSHIALYSLGPSVAFDEPGAVGADWTELQSYLLVDPDGDYANWQTSAWIGGTLTLSESSTVYGQPVVGSGTFTVWGG